MSMICEHVHRIAEVFYIFGLLWQCSMCTKNPVYQLILCFLFSTCISEIKSRPYIKVGIVKHSGENLFLCMGL